MTRRHFRALAEIVARLVGLVDEGVRFDLADALADFCGRENPRFDRGQFRHACGVSAVRPRAASPGVA